MSCEQIHVATNQHATNQPQAWKTQQQATPSIVLIFQKVILVCDN